MAIYDRYSRPSFLTGVARLFDFWGLFDADKPRAFANDAEALASDWRMVGEDLRVAMNEFRKSSKV